MEKLFTAVKTAYDPKNRPVFICKDDANKFFVYKPQTGFKSRLFDSKDDENLNSIFERESHNGQAFAAYHPGDRDEAAPEGNAPLEKDVNKPAKKRVKK